MTRAFIARVLVPVEIIYEEGHQPTAEQVREAIRDFHEAGILTSYWSAEFITQRTRLGQIRRALANAKPYVPPKRPKGED